MNLHEGVDALQVELRENPVEILAVLHLTPDLKRCVRVSRDVGFAELSLGVRCIVARCIIRSAQDQQVDRFRGLGSGELA